MRYFEREKNKEKKIKSEKKKEIRGCILEGEKQQKGDEISL